MSKVVTHTESKVISKVSDVLQVFKDQNPVAVKGKLSLPLEIKRKPMVTTKGLIPDDPKARVTQIDEDADWIEELGIAGYSIYHGENAGGDYRRVVAHLEHSHALTIIKVQYDKFSDGTVKQRLYLSKDHAHPMLLVKENETVQQAVRKVPELTDTVWF